MISAIENLSPEILKDVLKELNRAIYSGAVISRYTFSEYKTFISFFETMGLVSNEYYSSVIGDFSPVEYQLMLTISKDLGNRDMRHTTQMMNQKCKRIVQNIINNLQRDEKPNNKKWWHK